MYLYNIRRVVYCIWFIYYNSFYGW